MTALLPDSFSALADLLAYPEEGYASRLAHALAVLERDEAAAPVMEPGSALRAWAASVSDEDAQELYTRTFDLSPVATLDLGWHVFGESYKRGALLVGLRGELREHGIDAGTELPDHLPLVLRLLAVMPHGEDREALRKGIVGPAMRSIAVAFHGSNHPFAPLLRAAAECVAPDVRRSAHLPVLSSHADPLKREVLGAGAMEGRHA